MDEFLHTCQGYPEYFREPHWFSMGLPEISRVTWQVCLWCCWSNKVLKSSAIHLRNCAICSLTWWRHQIETFSALLALCVGNSPVTVEFPTQMPVTRSFDDFFHLCLNKRWSKHWWGWWFETPSRSLWRQCNGRKRYFGNYNVIYNAATILQWAFIWPSYMLTMRY